MPTVLVFGLLGLWLGFLILEAVRLRRDRAAIPLRIAVTGTRGKTTVTRLLASVLRESGQVVLAKTTGSEARYIEPDGTEVEIRRRGVPSILEQKRLLRRGARLGADALVAEVMSLHPENHWVEAREILHPHLVLATNFHVDHRTAQGDTRDSVARVLALDVPPGTRALVPQEEWEPAFGALVEEGGGTSVQVPAMEDRPGAAFLEAGPNLDLVWAAARLLGVEEEAIHRGVGRAGMDLGALRVWDYPAEGGGGPSWRVVNAFAANDPASTLHLFDRVMEAQPALAGKPVGLLNLRADRGDRTLQWVEALRESALTRFSRLYVAGFHARALRHQLRRTEGGGLIRL
ncbi:Mur ligase family protein, partial [Gemmatimonadota bacterium]